MCFHRSIPLALALSFAGATDSRAQATTYTSGEHPLEFIDTSFEKASPVWYDWHSPGTFRNSGTLGEGWLQRYDIDAVVHEFNCNWIVGLNEPPSARHWQTYGENLATVFDEYFGRVKPS